MKLLGTDTSPYVRKARLVLLEKNIPHDYVVDLPREPGSQVVRVNPLGRIPALILFALLILETVLTRWICIQRKTGESIS